MLSLTMRFMPITLRPLWYHANVCPAIHACGMVQWLPSLCLCARLALVSAALLAMASTPCNCVSCCAGHHPILSGMLCAK